MRILMVTQFYWPTVGGQERVVEDLSRELIARGHHVAVAALQQGGLPSVSEVSGVRVYRISSTAARFFPGYSDPERPHAPPAVDPKAKAELRRIVRLEKPDIVHGHDWLIHSFLPLKRRRGPGLVVTLHDHSLVCANKRLIRGKAACSGPGPAKCLRCSAAYYGLAKGPAITLGNWVMSTAERALVDLFLPVSRVVAEASRLRGRPDRQRVIPNFLPKTATEPTEDHKLPGLPRKFILFAGDVSRDKGVGVLLRAHELLEDAPPLVLIGRVVEPEILAPIVGAERASRPELLAAPIGNVRAVGAQPHEVVLDAFRRCTVAVVPSLMHEAFGLVALEAMSAGRPVVASDIGGLRDIIRDGKDGILVAPGDAEALYTALARVLDDTNLRRRLRTAARRRADDFAAEQIVPQVEQAYNDVLAARQERTARGRRRLRPARADRGIRPWRRGVGASLLAHRRGHLRAASMAASAHGIRQGLQSRETRAILALTALSVAGTAIPAGAGTPARIILVLPLALFLPGYALTNAIFGRRSAAEVERLALALGLSLVTAALASLALDFLPSGLTLYSWAASLALVTTAATLADAALHPTVANQTRPAPPRGPLPLPRRRPEIIVMVVAACLVAAAVALARTPLPSPSAHGYTALWLTRDPHSSALVVGVRSEEHRRTRYVLRVMRPGATTTRKLTLAPGQSWQEKLHGAGRAAASLYRVGHHGVYRSVRLSPSRSQQR
jgi:glycosyltransferase involved in cell wall biosynthesis